MKRLSLAMFVLCLSAGFAVGQEKLISPIVELKVMPEKSVFNNSAWNKPIVIKSQEEAAKHFGKDAREWIAMKVDFNKQIVLVFAWKGSGGDKLEYKFSGPLFPVQIPFSLRPGKTDDLRSHSHVFALLSNVAWSVQAPK
jgi:hypothetical protein